MPGISEDWNTINALNIIIGENACKSAGESADVVSAMWMKILKTVQSHHDFTQLSVLCFRQEPQCCTKKSIEFLFYVLENRSTGKNNWIFVVPCQAPQ